MEKKKELIIGCGKNGHWEKNLKMLLIKSTQTFDNPTTLDINPQMEPDIIHDLNQTPYPFEDNTFDEIHAYEVLEHLGQQGDIKTFYQPYNELYRILKPGGLLIASTPKYDSIWAWGDPGHTRIINQGTLAFLSKRLTATTRKHNPMSDYREIGNATCDFEAIATTNLNESLIFALKAIK